LATTDNTMKKTTTILASLLATGFGANAAVVYSNDFNGAGAGVNGVASSGATVGSEAATGFVQDAIVTADPGGTTHTFLDVTGTVTGQFFLAAAGNVGGGDAPAGAQAVSTYTVTLNNLPAHTSLDIGLLLAAGGGLDTDTSTGIDPGLLRSDSFTIAVDGNIINSNRDQQQFFTRDGRGGTGNVFGTQLVANSSTDTDGTDFLDERTGGWGMDTLHDLGADDGGGSLAGIPHTNSSVTIVLTATVGEGFGDESISIANLTVDTAGIPEPTSALLAGLGLLGFIGRRRR